MGRASGFLLFILVYLLFIFVVFFVNYTYFSDHFADKSGSGIWLFSISQATMTHFNFQSVGDSSVWFQLFSIFSTQATGLAFYSILLWLFHQLFSEKNAVNYTPGKAFKKALLVSAICEAALFAFFLYGIPAELTGGHFMSKLFAALTLAVNSFNHAGFSLWPMFFQEGVVETNFIIQIGIIGGALLGGLGIFVLLDLFSPGRLRKRLHDPTIDWSFMTKLSFYGGVAMLAGFLMLFLLTQKSILSDKNILESMAMGLMEAAAARGFGMHISAATASGLSSIAYYVLAFTGSGPFTTGGGATLLGLLFIYVLFKKKSALSGNVHKAYLISKNWIFISLAVLLIVWFMNYSFNSEITSIEFFDIYLTNNMTGGSTDNFSSLAIKTLTNIAGRLSFMLACFWTLTKKG